MGQRYHPGRAVDGDNACGMLQQIGKQSCFQINDAPRGRVPAQSCQQSRVVDQACVERVILDHQFVLRGGVDRKQRKTVSISRGILRIVNSG